METNESILTREIVSIDDRKRLGKMKELRVDCDAFAVSHYIINSTTTNAPLVLPFDKSLAVGDTFITIQKRGDFLSTSDGTAKAVIDNGFRLLGVDVFSRTGNKLGTVESYDFDPTYGLITKINLGKDESFAADSFVFFAPEFVFVDDGGATAAELREGEVEEQPAEEFVSGVVFVENQDDFAADAPAEEAVEEAPQAVEEVVETVVEEPIDLLDKVLEPVEEPAAEEAPVEAPVETPAEAVEAVAETVVVEEAVEESDEDAVLKEFLIDAVLNDDVESKDGEFKVTKGTKLTKELVDEAQKHDALLLLTMSVEA